MIITIVRLKSALLIVTLSMTGCTQVGPDFQKPDADINPQWDQYESQLVQATTPESTEWWQAFNDPVLDDLVDKAYAQNLTLEAAGLRVLEARAQLGLAVGSVYPQQQAAGGSAIYTDRGGNAGDSSNWQYDLGVGVGWELDFWGKFRRGIESADAAFLASVANPSS